MTTTTANEGAVADTRKRITTQGRRPLNERLRILHKPDAAGFCTDDGQHYPCTTARILQATA